MPQKIFCRIKERKIWKFVGRSKRLDMEEEEVAICVAKERTNIDAIKKNLKKIVRNNARIIIVTTDFPHSPRKQSSIMEREKIIQWSRIISMVKSFKSIHSIFQKKK